MELTVREAELSEGDGPEWLLLLGFEVTSEWLVRPL